MTFVRIVKKVTILSAQTIFVPKLNRLKQTVWWVAHSRHIFLKVFGVPGNILLSLFPP